MEDAVVTKDGDGRKEVQCKSSNWDVSRKQSRTYVVGQISTMMWKNSIHWGMTHERFWTCLGQSYVDKLASDCDV